MQNSILIFISGYLSRFKGFISKIWLAHIMARVYSCKCGKLETQGKPSGAIIMSNKSAIITYGNYNIKSLNRS